MFRGPNTTTADGYLDDQNVDRSVDHVDHLGPCNDTTDGQINDRNVVHVDHVGPRNDGTIEHTADDTTTNHTIGDNHTTGDDAEVSIDGTTGGTADDTTTEGVEVSIDDTCGDTIGDSGEGVEVSIDGLFLELLDGFVGVPPRELNAQVGELELRRRALDAEMAASIHVAEMSGAFSVDGHRCMSGFLKAKLNWSGVQTAQWLKISRFIAIHTSVGDAWAAGRIGYDQVHTLQSFHGSRRVRHVFDQFLPLLLLKAEQLLFADFEQAVAHTVARADEDGGHLDRDTAVEHRNAHIHVNGAELDVTVIGGDPVTAAEIVAIFDLACQHEFDADVAARAAEFGDDAANHPLPRTAGQRRHDAFLRVFRAGGAAIANDVTAGTTSIAKIVVRVVIDEETFREILAGAGLAPAGMIRDAIGELTADPTGLLTRKCQLSDGTPIHPHDALRALLQGYVQRVVVDANSVVVDMGRESRLFTGSARQAALILVTHCDHPGCDLPAEWCDVDHNIEWANGGRTDQNNSRPRCSTHNRFKSRNRWRSEQATNGYHYTIREDGTIVLPIGARPPTFAQPDNPVRVDPVRNGTVDKGPIDNDPVTNDPVTNDPVTNDTADNDTADNDTVQSDEIYFRGESVEFDGSVPAERDDRTGYIYFGYDSDDAHLHDPAEIERLTHITRQRVRALRAV